MSVYAIEKALWQSCAEPADAQRLREDAQAYLKEFRLDDDERALLAAWDISGLVDRGVHPMVLMMAFAAINGPAAMGEYVGRLHGPSQAASSR